MTTDTDTIQRRKPLPKEVADRIRHSIMDGDIGPDGKLPTQAQLCNTYGVSRPVVREAIWLLKSEGLVISQQGRGQFANREGSSVFRIQPNFDDRADLARMFEFLIPVEASATALAAQRRTEAELTEIQTWLNSLEISVANEQDASNDDFEFHNAILKAAHNDYYISFGEFLEANVRRLIRAARNNTARYSGLIEQVMQEHREIYSAIEKRNEDAAYKAASQHLRNAANRLRIYKTETSNSFSLETETQ